MKKGNKISRRTLLQSMGLEVDAFGQGSKTLRWS
jgi:hypothetical protein